MLSEEEKAEAPRRELSVEQLKAERERLDGVRERLWGELNQAIGAAHQLDLLIAYLASCPA